MGRYVKFPDWNAGDADKGEYQVGSVVYYEPPVPNQIPKLHQPTGYGYIATEFINDKVARKLPPNSTNAWRVHPYYAPLWDSSRKYAKGDRVFHILGKKYDNEPFDLNDAFIYKATLRYNGGSKPPNEDVDSMGIRTWELETTPMPAESLPDLRPWLFPVKKKRGIFQPLNQIAGRDARFIDEVAHPEEGFDYAGWIDPPLLDDDYVPIDPPPRVPKQYENWHTSVFQASPYNEDVYTREGIELKQDDDGNDIYVPFELDTAIHWAKWVNRYGWLTRSNDWANIPVDEKRYWTIAESQFIYTRQQPVDPAYPAQPAWSTYMSGGGFSMEMWGTLSSSEYEFINKGPSFVSNRDLPWIDAWATPVLVSGETTDYEGNVVSEATPIEYCKSDVIIQWNNTAFQGRTVTLFFQIISTQYYWDKQYRYYDILDGDGKVIDKLPILDGNGQMTYDWVYKASPIQIRIVTQRYNTSPSAYKHQYLYMLRDSNIDGINWSDLRAKDQVNSVGVVGFSYD